VLHIKPVSELFTRRERANATRTHIMDVAVRHGDERRAVCEVNKPVVVVLVVILVARHVDVVDSNVVGVLHCERVSVVCKDFGDLDVANDDVRSVLYAQANADKG